MDEFKSFNLKKVEELRDPSIAEGIDFESELGEFNWHQDRLIRFGKSKYMLTLVLFLLVSYGFSVIANLDVILASAVEVGSNFTQLGWAKFLSIVSLIVASIPVIGFLDIYIQSRKASKRGVINGLETISIFIAIMYILFAISVAAVVIMIILLMFRAFLFVVLLGAILGGFLYFYWSLLTQFNKFIKDCIQVLDHRKEVATLTPDSTKLFNYFVGLLILTVIGGVIRFFEINQIPAFISPVTSLIQSPLYVGASLIISIGLQVTILVLINYFDGLLSGGIFIQQKQKQPYRYDGYEDMFE